MKKWSISRIYRIPLIYGLFSALWILFSDKLAFMVAADATRAQLYSTIKGLFFIVSSTLLIYLLLRIEESGKRKLINEIAGVQRSFNLLFEDNPLPMWIYNNETLEIMAVNPSACRTYGYTSDEFRKIKITDLRPPEEVPVLLKTLAGYKDDLRQTGPLKHLKKDGEPLIVQVVSHPMKSGGMETTLVSIIDLTDQQKTLSELDAVAQQRDQYESFGYTASHDLKAPLRAILGYSDILRKEYRRRLDDEGIGFVEQIYKAGLTMSQMLDEMLILTGINRKPLNKENINLSEYFYDIFKTLKLQEPARQVEVSIQPDMFALADVGAVNLIIHNLFQNAWKYTKNTEHARIEVGRSDSASGESYYYIKDNGMGFDQALASQVFEPFKRVQRNSVVEGMGIGLSIVKRAVERHGGRVWVEAETGKGATFYFTLGDDTKRATQ